MKKITPLILLSISLYVQGANYSDFDQYQETVTRHEVEARINNNLKHDASISDFFTITDAGLHLYASAGNKQAGIAEFMLRFGKKPKAGTFCLPANISPNKPLTGLRVALDPGHVGGQYARIEERYIDLDHPELDNPIQFDEGTLSVLTAQLLAGMLRDLGAEVMLTREKPGQAVYEKSFDVWCHEIFGITKNSDWQLEATQENINIFLRQKTPQTQLPELQKRLQTLGHAQPELKITFLKQALFRCCYNNLDLRARAAKINTFGPHITLMIHYNSGNIGTNDNYNLTFVPGSFLHGELATQEARYEFTRLALTSALDQSVTLSTIIAQNLEQDLDIRLMNSGFYSRNNVLHVAPGVYCRNLALTRLVHSPLCYGETLLQNNYDEAVRLAQKDIIVDGVATSSRIAQIAASYCKSICSYARALGL